MQADSLFRLGEYEQVELLVLRADRQGDLPTTDRVALELLGGYSLIMLERESEARAHFARALELDSALVLDPIQVSPKFRTVFDDVKREWMSTRTMDVPTAAIREFTIQQGARPSSQLLNLALPGAGFLAEGRSVRGLIYIAAQAGVTALWLSELSQNNSARKDYLAADSASVERLYETYDSHHRRMWTYGLAAGALYIVSQIDLAFLRIPVKAYEIVPTEFGARLQIHL
ncbi:hypothetical protein KJZ99_09880 [bacterium]|nr:hypothetical protein [bacterium]